MLLHALVYPCLEDGSLSRFIAALKSIDPTLESFRRELSAAGDHFMSKKLYNVAYVFQDLLKVSSYVFVTLAFSSSVSVQNFHFTEKYDSY